MGITSRTGLLPSPRKKLIRHESTKTVQLKAIAKQAPYVLKPFAGLYNPYPYGCSLLCNHPADTEAKELLKRVKDSWATEGRNVLLAEEIAAIRAGLENFKISDKGCVSSRNIDELPVAEIIPEELFRRYTDTDSRPLTPAPTLASAHTRASGSRRCVTPDPTPMRVKEKTLLVLDLRRSHSQETISCSCYSLSHLDPPTIRIVPALTRDASPESAISGAAPTPETNRKKYAKNLNVSCLRRPKSVHEKTEDKNEKSYLEVKTANQTCDKNCDDDYVGSGDEEEEKNAGEEEEEEFIKRRGRKRRKRGRDSSRGPPAFQSSIDPETQVATIGTDSHNPSARPSLVPNTSAQENTELSIPVKNKNRPDFCDIDSYLDKEILRHLRRELNEEVIDNEFNHRRRKALEEAIKTISSETIQSGELKKLQEELNLPPVNAELWLSLPRVFTRSSARFELPMDSRSLNTMTPLEYVKELVSITSARKLLYNCIFNKFKIEMEVTAENEYKRRMQCRKLPEALNLMMGKNMTEKQSEGFKELIGWNDEDTIDFKTFCGLCALCERLLAPEYCQQLPDRKADPCHEVEKADFESLPRRLKGQTLDKRMVKILYGIKNL